MNSDEAKEKALFSVAGRTGQRNKSHHKILCSCGQYNTDAGGRQGQMTIEEMLASDKPVLTPADIAPVLGRKPYSISIAAKDHPEQLGFPVSRIGTITVIPRISFLKFLGYEVEA
jgi:hypothetical protein